MADKAFIEKVRKACESYGVQNGGVTLLGLSGGGDSVAMLFALREVLSCPLVAVHVNHGIRGQEADKDQAFCTALCESLGIPIEVYSFNVPELAKAEKTGLEEAGRNARRAAFSLAAEKHGAKTLALAHNADDLAETVLFNLIRGAGIKGMRGILPVSERDGLTVIRPIIDCTKEEILNFLNTENIRYRTDLSNLSRDYTRNKIRLDVLPLLKEINPACRENIISASKRACEAYSLIAAPARDYLNSRGHIERKSFLALHPAVASEVLSMLSGIDLSSRQRENLYAFVARAERGMSIDISEDSVFFCDGDIFRFEKRLSPKEYLIPLSLGYTPLPTGFVLHVGLYNTQPDINIYKLVKRIIISSDIFEKGIFVRSKKAGDSVRYSSMTHSAKKLLSDAKVPSHTRQIYPVVCDTSGVLWIPPFSPRDGIRGDGRYAVSYLEPIERTVK